MGYYQDRNATGHTSSSTSENRSLRPIQTVKSVAGSEDVFPEGIRLGNMGKE
jgi:hypothetical protein